MIDTAVILCSGLATRFLPTSKVIPKEMLPVYDKPLLHKILDNLNGIGIKKCYIQVSRDKQCIVDYFKKHSMIEDYLEKRNKLDELHSASSMYNFDFDIKFIYQDVPMGTGHCVELLQKEIGEEPFLLLFGDNLIDSKYSNPLASLCENFEKYKKSVILVQSIDKKEANRFSIIDFEKINGNDVVVKNIVEKPGENAPSNLAYIGAGIITSDIYEPLKACTIHPNGEKYLTDAFEILAKRGRLNAHILDGINYDFGDRLHYFLSNIDYILKRCDESGAMRQYILQKAREINEKSTVN